MSLIEFLIIVIACILFIKPEQLPEIIKLIKKVYLTLSGFLRQQEKQLTQSSQLEWLNKKMTNKKDSKNKE